MPNRIEICGAIAAGKTTLATSFSALDRNIVLEDFSKISMLDDFYSDPASFSFETEMSFTLQHYYQAKKALMGSNSSVFDFSSADDYAFALVTLNEKEMQIYNQAFSYILERLGKPEKLIKLTASPDELAQRISKRGRNNEKGIDKGYLVSFLDSLEETINRFYYDVPLIVFDTEKHSPVDYTPELLRSL